MRAQLIALTKRLIWWGMRRPLGAKLAKLVSEERLVFLHHQMLRRIGPEWGKNVGTVVREGPFKGLHYPVIASVGSEIFPKMLGSYEAELHPSVEAIIARRYPRIVNIGAAEGFYAVGLARRMPNTVVEAFEMDESAHPLLRGMAEANGVSGRVNLHGVCTTEELNRLALHNDLLLVDCEGAEIDLLDPASVPGLETCDILVELHTVRGRSTGETLASLLGRTHRLTSIPSRRRDPDDFPLLATLPQEDRWAILHERTSDFGWAWYASNKAAPTL